MKLKNKKTGEIATLTMSNNGESLMLMQDGKMLVYDVRLSDLKEWEDVPKKPKGIQFIYRTDHFGKAKVNGVFIVFETKEEAERAVEKLKAWKRLKDKGFEFAGRDKPNYGEEFIIKCHLPADTLVIDVASDLQLLFGGYYE